MTDTPEQTASSPFAALPNNPSFPSIEHDILSLWDRLDAFHQSNSRRADGEPFVFYDGPPFATGTPHYGHLLAGTIKDIVPRYWNMRGHPVTRRFGWDCHGLPIEALAQDALGLAGAGAIADLGIDKFNEQCRSMVSTYVEQWRQTVTRMGRWVDFDNDYKTMAPSFMESVWWVFKELWKKQRIYRAHRIMPYSWKLTTPLSNFEANSNYKDVQDPAITVRFKLTSPVPNVDGDCYICAWTTTPWTLPENLALGVGPEIVYAVLTEKDSGDTYIVAKERLSAVWKNEDAYELVTELSGADIAGATYEPLFPYFADQPNAFQVLAADFVSTGDGTGIVHLAPAYGEDDYAACRAAEIDFVDPLNDECQFTSAVPDYEGQFCKDADKAIIKRLKDEGKLVKQATIVHSYPFCERTETPLIYRAIKAWYVKVEDLRDDLEANNQQVHWVPEHVGDKRFGNWLRDAKDWNISRNRFWGSCIPVWINVDDEDDCLCVGSIDELAELSGVVVDDLHKHIVDKIVIEKDGKTYKRTPEVLDCWFESGAMPYAQFHYPFEREGELNSLFPAQFIAEGLDQTRGWFYTLLILGTTLFGESPYRNVVVNGLVLAEDGKKMSKRLKNYPDPNEVLEQYGADALRAYLINSPVVRGEALRFSEAGLKDIIRTVVLPYWNALSFFVTYARIDGWQPKTEKGAAVTERSDLDRWLLSNLQSLLRDVGQEMEGYRLYNVVPRLVSFIDDLTNWYVRLSRERFWGSDMTADKQAAYDTLYTALTTFAQVLAPFMPFLTEEIHQRLVVAVNDDAPQSVHWCDYPQANESLIDAELETGMAYARRIVALGRKLREDVRIKIRQPLQTLTVVHRDPAVQAAITAQRDLICSELNIKDMVFESDEAAYCQLTIKPNFATLRQKCPDKIKAIVPALRQWSFGEIEQLEAGNSMVVADVELELADVLIERKATDKAGADAAMASDGSLTVVLDTSVTPELRREGLAREFISAVQNERKTSGLELTDRIAITWSTQDEDLRAALTAHADIISNAVLATSIAAGDANTEPRDFAGTSGQFVIQKCPV
jgi:isoleucyl-tRNA synthetase